MPQLQLLQAGPADINLAIAVAETGAKGSLPLTWMSPERAAKSVNQVKSATNGTFFVNYVLNFPPIALEKVLEVGVPAVQFSWGMPSKAVFNIATTYCHFRGQKSVLLS